MVWILVRARVLISVSVSLTVALAVFVLAATPLGQVVQTPPAGAGQAQAGPNFERDLQRQAETDKTWRAASEGFMRMEKVSFKSRVGGVEIPAFLFQPLQVRGPKGHPALVWVHENIRGHLYEHYIPYIREAVGKGYVVIAPQYRGGLGYGKEFYDAIDYGGAEVDDVLAAVDYVKANLAHVDASRLGIIGWSHGGMITLLSIFKETTTFKAAVAMVPVTNLFQRLAYKGVERQHQAIDPANRFGGLPHEKRDVYKERSPIYSVDKLEIPLLVHITRNDQDVNIEECMQLVDALRARKPQLSETKIYDAPLGGHTFDRRVNPKTWQPENTREQRDSWNRVWTFLDWNLDPYR